MVVKNKRQASPLAAAASSDAPPLAGAPSFIEHQFPVAQVSAESYKERKANYSQTLTGLGKWWGRKPLVLVRATILGLLLPATGDPKRDREVFLKLMTMDDRGLTLRKDKSIPGSRLVEELLILPPSVQKRFLDPDASSEEPRVKRLSREGREELQHLVFSRMPYSEKLQYCRRPEQIAGPPDEAWAEINAHLGTAAASLPELVEELGKAVWASAPGGRFVLRRRQRPLRGRADRLRCLRLETFRPSRRLLTWAALNIVGGGETVARQVQEAQREIFAAVDRQVTEWGIEHNEQGWRADAYLYCVEVVCPECGWRVPLAPSWVIGEKTRTVGELVPDEAAGRFEIEICEGVSPERMKHAKASGTVRDSRLWCPHCGRDTPIDLVRRQAMGKDPNARYHQSGLRFWENDDLVPRPDDVFQERLYCIRWVEPIGAATPKASRWKDPSLPRADCRRPPMRGTRVLELLRPAVPPVAGKRLYRAGGLSRAKMTEPIRTRGWTHWHHLFTPRQLLLHGLISCEIGRVAESSGHVAGIFALAKCCNFNAKLSQYRHQAKRSTDRARFL